MSAPARILIVGDVHGDIAALRAAFEQAQEKSCEALVQLGDFGWWPHVEWGYRFVEAAKALIAEFELPLYFIDGNHDNHPDLWQAHESVTADGFHQLADNFFYIPRGLRWNWHGVGFLALGGGHSIDQDMRQPGKSWWPTELLSEEEIQLASANSQPIEIMFSHDCPEGAGVGFDLWAIPLAVRSRQDVRRVVDHAGPKRIYHGHYHHRHDDRYLNPHTGHQVEVIGLADQEDREGLTVVLDLAEWRRAQTA